ncbi:hypothetical protein F4810DRAFT_715755 [Camillea tinctor]|nr:hypothetical protein F4810DRAFT_715755 [Camillea tinctor]
MLPYKRQSKTSDSNLEPDNFPPEFYDSLDILFLTKRALREFDRRNNSNPAKRKKSYSEPLPSLARLSRQGGPDITDLRGWPEPEDNPDISDYEPQSSMAEYVSESTMTRIKNPHAKRLSPYDANFEQMMARHGIYMPDQLFEKREISIPENMDDIYQLMTKRRQSLDLEVFTEEDFRSVKARFRDVSEACVTHTVLPHIQECKAHSKIPSRYNDLFNNMQSIGDKGVVKPKPDIWDGICATAVHTAVENALGKFITPKTSPQHALVAPNFFIEVNGPDGALRVAERQALNDGAYGARAMHSLQNFMSAKPSFDNKAYTFSATYIHGVLSLYAHHMTCPGPDPPDGLPEYWMTLLDAYSMKSHRRAFVSGATAFRNIRELAWRNREDAVQAANARVLDLIEADSSKGDSSDSHDERPPPPPSKHRKFKPPSTSITAQDLDKPQKEYQSDVLVNLDKNLEREIWGFACAFSGHDPAKTDGSNPEHHHSFQGLVVTIKPHQLRAVTRILFMYHFENSFGILLADSMGVGKTLEGSCGVILTPHIRLAAQEVRRDRQYGRGRHLPASTPEKPQPCDSECPSGTHIRGFACLCVERLPTAQLICVKRPVAKDTFHGASWKP